MSTLYLKKKNMETPKKFHENLQKHNRIHISSNKKSKNKKFRTFRCV